MTAIARRLETGLRSGDEKHISGHDRLVARLEDDYFAVLLEGLTEIVDSKEVADKLLAELKAPIALGNRHVYVSASIGIAVSVTGYSSAEAMLRDAETALHRARALGGSRSEVFDTTSSARNKPPCGSSTNAGRARTPRVRRGLSADRLARPKRIVGFEALVRLGAPQRWA